MNRQYMRIMNIVMWRKSNNDKKDSSQKSKKSSNSAKKSDPKKSPIFVIDYHPTGPNWLKVSRRAYTHPFGVGLEMRIFAS